MQGEEKRRAKKAPLVPEISYVYGELTKSKSKARLVLSGIIAVQSLSPMEIAVASHSGGVTVVGDNLKITVFQNKTVEVSGCIKEVRLGYIKS